MPRRFSGLDALYYCVLFLGGGFQLTDVTGCPRRLPLPETNPQLRSTSQILQATQALLAGCPTSRYVLVAQPNLHASDLRDAHTGHCLVPTLCGRSSSSSSSSSRFDVAEVVGPDLSAAELRASIGAACAARGKAGVVVDHQLDALPPATQGRREAVAAMDARLGEILDAEEGDYTVIYFSSPHEAQLRNYESEFDDVAAPMELKRRSAAERLGEGVGRRAAAGNSSSAPLFVKYQFFTPGKLSPPPFPPSFLCSLRKTGPTNPKGTC